MNKIKKMRLEKCMTATEVCKIVGCANSSLSLWESGKRKPCQLTLYKLAKALECDPSDLQE
jgi:transcriptional regulator with XRE-family HTH domain